MSEFIHVMAAPFAACVLLVLVHAALGRHVLARGVIFVDLAMAQIAALGGAVAFLLGHEVHSPASYVYSFGFTLLGAALFSFLWDRNHSVIQEAFIGIAFAFGGALSLLLLSGSPHGAEEFQSSLIGGGLLWLTWGDVAVMAALYGIVGLFLWRKNSVLMRCSESHDAAQKHGHNVRLWDFLFYSAFGLVVTSSVKAAGILAVFTFLIVPSVCAVLLGKRKNAQLVWAWIIGILGSVVAVSLSYAKDWPTGASVVCVFGGLVTVISVATHAGFQKLKGDRLGINR
jgi:zinc/manganese transport system permease protein